MPRLLTLLAPLAILSPPIAAAAKPPELRPLPAEKLEAMTELLRHGDVALIESQPDGRLRQVSVMTLVAAPPKLVHDVVANLAHYPDFVHNVTRCSASPGPDGSVEQHFVVSYTLINITGCTRHFFLPDGAITYESTDPNDAGHFRWEFHPVAAGTVLVLYGYTDVLHSTSLVRSAVRQARTMEHGLALGVQLVPLRGVKQRAEALAGGFAQASATSPKVKPPGFGFLLDRGAVAVLRYTAAGRLSDLSLLERIGAPIERVEATVLAPEAYATIFDATPRSLETKRDGEGIAFRLKTDLPVASWESHFLMRADGQGGIDVAALDGDLRGARYRWDLKRIAPSGTLAVLRMSQSLGASSLALRALFNQEPLFEHGFNVALGLNELEGVAARAEARR